MDQPTIEQLVERTREGAVEVIKLLKTAGAYYTPSAVAAQMVESILNDDRKILPCSAYLEGEYGMSGLFATVPAKLGTGGIQRIYQIALTEDEQAKMERAADEERELLSLLK